MFKLKSFIFAACFTFLTSAVFAYEGFLVLQDNKPMEISLFGGIAVSDTSKKIDGVKTDIGGSGYSAGFSALGLLNNYLGVGVDFSYTNDGYGSTQKISGNNTDLRIEHFTPLLLLKTYIVSPAFSKFSLYVPLGAGMDFARISKRINGDNDNLVSDTVTGPALMGGLGAEVNFDGGTFIAFEGRYTRSFFLGSNDYNLKNSGNFAVLFKAGIKFDYGYDFLY